MVHNDMIEKILTRDNENDTLSSRAVQIGAAAQKAMLFELSASPKPGLVDRSNNGAHSDMDFLTFIRSITALADYFTRAAYMGLSYREQNLPGLFTGVRKLGVEAEKKMFTATKGINTHKGQIFSLGLLSAAAGYTVTQEKNSHAAALNAHHICNIAAAMCKGIIKQDLEPLLANSGQRALTYGEKLYVEHGITGIRGEAENGFLSVRDTALPAFQQKMHKNPAQINDHMIESLLLLMTVIDDVNVLGRGGLKRQSLMQDLAFDALQAGSMTTVKGKNLIDKMDHYFIKENISPGGCADLLAVTLFLYFLEHERPDE